MKTFDQPPDIIIFGGPGSGKSTQAEFVTERLRASHLNMGNIMRQVVAERLPGFEEIRTHQAQGTLVPDEVSAQLAQNFLEATPKDTRVVFDGYPRTIAQVRDVENIEKREGREAAALYLRLPPTVAEQRLLKRAKKEGRADDTPEVIKDRIALFEKTIQPMLEYYSADDRLITINSNQSIEDVRLEVERAFDQL
ncbi:nucleoside monophosphate kinase [Patescibacteria group bacterium]|nr:nucleoside monophosphate kinase [Patescibacteria group bacterium]